MKKYLILLIIPLLFFSTGCEKEEIVNGISINTDLVGAWKSQTFDGEYYFYYLFFFSDGSFERTNEYGDSGLNELGSYTVTDNYIGFGDEIFGGSSYADVFEFDVDGDILTLTYMTGGEFGTWKKQD